MASRADMAQANSAGTMPLMMADSSSVAAMGVANMTPAIHSNNNNNNHHHTGPACPQLFATNGMAAISAERHAAFHPRVLMPQHSGVGALGLRAAGPQQLGAGSSMWHAPMLTPLMNYGRSAAPMLQSQQPSPSAALLSRGLSGVPVASPPQPPHSHWYQAAMQQQQQHGDEQGTSALLVPAAGQALHQDQPPRTAAYHQPAVTAAHLVASPAQPFPTRWPVYQQQVAHGSMARGGASISHRQHAMAPDGSYVCAVCGKTFTSSSNLNRHRRIHTGEKPYSCQYCKMTFNNSSNRRKHERLTCKQRPAFASKRGGRSSSTSDTDKATARQRQRRRRHRAALRPSVTAPSQVDKQQQQHSQQQHSHQDRQGAQGARREGTEEAGKEEERSRPGGREGRNADVAVGKELEERPKDEEDEDEEDEGHEGHEEKEEEEEQIDESEEEEEEEEEREKEEESPQPSVEGAPPSPSSSSEAPSSTTGAVNRCASSTSATPTVGN